MRNEENTGFKFPMRTIENEAIMILLDSPFRQTFELGILISTAGKSILNLVKWLSLVKNIVKNVENIAL